MGWLRERLGRLWGRRRDPHEALRDLLANYRPGDIKAFPACRSDTSSEDLPAAHPFQGRFVRGCRYVSESDALVCYLEDVLCRCEPQGCGVDLFRCLKTGRVVGFRVWGLSGILRGEGPT